MFFDIATVPMPQNTATAPFDWGLYALTGAPVALPWHDAADLCAGAIERVSVAVLYGFVLEPALHTAVIHSLFTDARAGDDDALPLHNTDKRGWVGESFIPNNAGNTGVAVYGSRLWLYLYTKNMDNVLEGARFAVHESLAWLIEDNVVDAVEVSTEFRESGSAQLMAIHIVMRKGAHSEPVYDAIWGATITYPEGYYV